MIGKFHAPAHFSGEKGIGEIEGIDVGAGGTQIVADVLFASDGGEEVVWTGRTYVQATPPKSIGVATEYREYVATWDDCIVPSGDGIERSVQAGVACKFTKLENVIGAFSRTTRTIFIFDLNANDRAAILPEQAVNLLSDFGIKAANRGQVNRIVFTRERFLEHPIRKAAVPCLAVIPRPNANPDIEAILAAELNKMAQVALSGPVEFSLGLLVVNPENVRRDDLDSSGFDLLNFDFPIRGRVTRVVELSHYWKPGFSISCEEAVVGGEHVSIGGRTTNGEGKRRRWRWLGRGVDEDGSGTVLGRVILAGLVFAKFGLAK